MATTKTVHDPDVLALYERLVSKLPDQRVKGKNNPYTSLNGHMFTFLDKADKISVRLPKTDREAFLKRYPDCVSVQYNTVMKEYVIVPDEILSNSRSITKLMQDSLAYVSGLKPRPVPKAK
ncbi:MAG: hypothetical protein KDB88_02210 [Flavobacteriales bacterium]|nr:hypothetical protein [Flavobacteriales bacterium]